MKRQRPVQPRHFTYNRGSRPGHHGKPRKEKKAEREKLRELKEKYGVWWTIYGGK
jgi:hypothetical protein